MVLENIETEFGEETVLVEGEGGKVITSPTNAHTPENTEKEPQVENTPEMRDEEPPAPEENSVTEETPTEEEAPITEEVPAAEETSVEETGRTVEEAPAPTEQEATQKEEEVANVEELDPNERDFDKNPTVLFAMIQKKEWTAAIERVQSKLDESKVWVSRKEKDGRLRWRLLPIHAAIVFKAPEHVVETLLAAFLKGAQSKDDQGMLPLHLAFRNGSSEGIVNLLLVAYPESINAVDRKGRIPLVLAQASTSPNKEAFMRALERGPGYYAVAAGKLMQVRQSHKHELDAAQIDAENKRCELQAKLEEMEKELMKTQETSQVLVDHVNSLEAQLNSRSDTERFLATKIATLDTTLKTSAQTKEVLVGQLKTENYSLRLDRDAFKLKYEELEKTHVTTQNKLTESLDLFERRETEWSKTEAELSQQVKSIQIDWANAQANCAILDAQLKKKMETEHALATQVSSLAGRLAESSTDSRVSSNNFNRRVKELEGERLMLRESVQYLTKRLSLVAQVLQNMTTEQNKIVEGAKHHECAISAAFSAHANIVADAMNQEKLQDQDRQEREEMKKLLAKQEEQVAKNEEKRSTIMSAIAVQEQHMENTKVARDEMLESVKTMGADVKDVLENILSILPKNVEQDDLVDAVVKNVMAPVPEKEEPAPVEEEKPEPSPPVDPELMITVDNVPTLTDKLTNDEDHTVSTEKSSMGTVADPEDHTEQPLKKTDASDRIMAARSDM
jgi:hypothetical protein